VAENFHYNIYLNNTIIGEGKADGQVSLKSNAVSKIANYTTVDIKKIIENYQYFIGKKTVPIEVEFFADFTALEINISKRITYNLEPKELYQKLLESPFIKNSYGIKSVKPISKNSTTTDVQIIFEIDNKSNVRFEINKLNLGIFTQGGNGKKLGNCVISQSFIVLPNQKSQIPINISVQNKDLASSILNSLFSNSSYLIQGKVSIKIDNEIVELPISEIYKM